MEAPPYAAVRDLIDTAIGARVPMSRQALEIATTLALRDELSALDLFVRPDLPADLAARLADPQQHASGRLPGGKNAHWAGAALLRPEANPHLLTRADVTALPIATASWLADRAIAAPEHVPDALVEHLMARPDMRTHVKAVVAAASPARSHLHELVRDAVISLGEQAEQRWGRTLVLQAQLHPDQTLVEALTLLGNRATPPWVRDLAARTWASPSALARINSRDLGPEAIARIIAVYIVPALAAPSTKAVGRLAEASNAALDGAALLDAQLLRQAWLDSQSLPKVKRETLARLKVALAAAGAPLDPPVIERPMDRAGSMPSGARLEVFTLFDQRAATVPQIWSALNGALEGGAVGAATWSDMAEALTAALTSDDEA